MEWISLAELRERSPQSTAVIETVTDEYGYDTPKLGYIEDSNPNAFTYGTARFNGRIVLTEGCFEFLDDGETASVVAHELGHITSRDFIIMTLANTIVQILYLVAIHSWRFGAHSGSNKDNQANKILFGVAILSYILWFVGEYMMLYLILVAVSSYRYSPPRGGESFRFVPATSISRVREYAADRFAAEYTHPDQISSALVKIAYGIVMSEDNPELSKATRNIGIMNVEPSKNDGMMYHNATQSDDPDLLLRAFLFDLKNPWAKLLELNSTHPLTGKRVRTLSQVQGAQRFDFEDILARVAADSHCVVRLYRFESIDSSES
jgi:Zn-dependent protease with chaperone function